MLKRKRLILIELNEINFDVAESYIRSKPDLFSSLAKLIVSHRIRTIAEIKYEELEPWIQWPSVHTGLSYAEHKIFRLGDMVGAVAPQIFEQLENSGFRVGAISAMNAENRLQNPAYFIPDPWTKTSNDGSFWSRSLSSAISQAVNDNAQSHISLKSALYLGLALLRFAQPKHYSLYWKLISRSREASWRKALVLDLLLHDIHTSFFKSNLPDFSTLFLNAGAHIQHHYFFNAAPLKNKTNLRNPAWYISDDADPIAEMLEVYDRLIGEYIDNEDAEVIIATGLSQCSYDRIKCYYRLKDHSAFLSLLGIEFCAVHPRMTRDFLIEFESIEEAKVAQNRLETIRVLREDIPLFGEIDNRGASLFVTLTYPHEIDGALKISYEGKVIPLAPHVVFVAIKNGMHQGIGFSFFSPGVAKFAPADNSHVKELYFTISQFFSLRSRSP